MDNLQSLKTCTKCQATKPLEDFNIARNRRDGRRLECKKCKYIQTKSWCNRNKDHVNRLNRLRNKTPGYLANTRRRVKLWKERHPERKKSIDDIYKLHFKNAEKGLTVEAWESIKEFYQNLCAYCKQSKPLVKSHLIPLSMNGTHTAGNIIPACVECASGRHDASIKPKVMYMIA